MNILKMELAASGLSEEEILAKAQLLMKAFGKEDAASTAEFKLLSKQKNKALVKAEIPPKDFSAVSLNIFIHSSIVTSWELTEGTGQIMNIYLNNGWDRIFVWIITFWPFLGNKLTVAADIYLLHKY